MNTSDASSFVNHCCFASACDLNACYCNDCGKPLQRCAAFEQCGGMLDQDGLCSVCIQPKLELDAGSLQRATVGGALALPLSLTNCSSVGRPVFIKGIWMREGTGEWNQCELPWDRIDAGTRKPFTLTANEMSQAGTHRLELVIAIESRWQWREEVVAFCTGLEITVEEDKELTVEQNIHYAPGATQTGATIYAPVRVTNQETTSDSNHKNKNAKTLPLTRASVYERSLGLRGASNGISIKRTTQLRWRGFVPKNAPADGPLVTTDGLLKFGRSKIKSQSGTSDVRLLAFRPDGSLDDENSRSISRDHFCIWIANDRLMFRVNSKAGASVNGKPYSRGESTELINGSQISPFIQQPERMSIKIEFEIEHGDVTVISLTRCQNV